VPVRKNWNVSTPAIPGTSSRRERGIFEKMKGSGIWWIRYADAYALKGALGSRPADTVTGPEIERALSKLAGERCAIMG